MKDKQEIDISKHLKKTKLAKIFVFLTSLCFSSNFLGVSAQAGNQESVKSHEVNQNFSELAEAQPAIKALIQHLLSIKNMQANFKQWVLDEKGQEMQQVDGVLTIQRPQKFRWETQEPFPQTIVSNGEMLWIHDEDLEQVTEQRLDTRMGNTPALLLSGDVSQIAQEFDVEQQTIDQGKKRFLLKPKLEEHQFLSLAMVFQGDFSQNKSYLLEMQLEDALGQKTLLEFNAVKVNENLKPELFEFTPPANTDVIREQ